MSGVLRIGQEEIKALKSAMERARAKPVTIKEIMRVARLVDQSTNTLTLVDRERSPPPERFAQQVELPVGYRVSISFEEQPAGMCLHVSMSIGAQGKVPGPEAVSLVMEAIGVENALHNGRVWIEDFLIHGKPGGKAVNVVVLMEESKAGNA
jgi:hypothetical protein